MCNAYYTRYVWPLLRFDPDVCVTTWMSNFYYFYLKLWISREYLRVCVCMCVCVCVSLALSPVPAHSFSVSFFPNLTHLFRFLLLNLCPSIYPSFLPLLSLSLSLSLSLLSLLIANDDCILDVFFSKMHVAATDKNVFVENSNRLIVVKAEEIIDDLTHCISSRAPPFPYILFLVSGFQLCLRPDMNGTQRQNHSTIPSVKINSLHRPLNQKNYDTAT